jgi:hypothetical protein
MKAKRIRDFVIYIVIGLAVGLGTVWYAFHFKTHNTEALVKWIGFSGITAILFGYAIHAHRNFLRSAGFWMVMSLLLAVHLVGFIFVLRRTQRWPLLWFVFIYPIENFAILWVLSVSSGLWRGRDVTDQRTV